MNNLTCLITGTTSGIGKYTALELANEGIRVIIVCRDKKRGQNIRKEIISKTKNNKVVLLVADLSLQSEIRKLARFFEDKYGKLDVLINNAGIFNSKNFLTKEGIEKTFAVNHLAYFLLTNLLTGCLKKSDSARVINVSSSAHKRGKINFDDLMGRKNYNGRRAYNQSKLANILFTKVIAKKLSSHNITVNSFHPGLVNTQIGKKSPDFSRRIVNTLKPLFAIHPQKAAKNLAYLALSSEVSNITGEYFIGKEIAQSSKLSNDSALASRLWDKSEELTNFYFKNNS